MYRKRFIFGVTVFILLYLITKGQKNSIVFAYGVMASCYFVVWILGTREYAKTIKKYMNQNKELTHTCGKVLKVRIHILKCIFIPNEITCTIQLENNPKTTMKFYIEYDEEFDVIEIISYEKC